MVWFKVDDGLAYHHKVVMAGNAAMGLWVRAGSFCAQQLTDGFIPDHMLGTLGNKAQAARLVDVGLWLRVEGGYQFHQWSEGGRQPTRAEVEAEREAARKRMQARRGSADVQANEPRSSGEQTPNFADCSEGVRGPRPDPSLPVVPNGTTRRAGRRTKAPDIMPITPAMTAWAAANNVTCDLPAATSQMLDHHRAKGSLMADWGAAWRTWMTNTKRFGGPTPAAAPDAWRYE